MTILHTIRLLGPWLVSRWEDGDWGSTQKVTMPSRWQDALGDFLGTVRLQRAFGCPGGLGQDRVVLVIEGGLHRTCCEVNGKACDLVQGRCDITDLLQGRNELSLQSGHCDSFFDEVRLEICDRC